MLSADDEDQTLGLYRFRQHICRPEDELKLYTQPLSSASVQFITHITISGDCLFTTPELLSLADMKNLGVLELIKPSDGMQAAYPQISDRLIRGWADAEDPFPLLRILKIWGHQTVTQASLRWACKFPSLALYDIMGAKDDWDTVYEVASSTGWRVSEHATRNDDSSILRSLLLLLPSDEQPTKRVSSLCRSIDTDLISFCCDSRCALKLVPHGEAPQLVDYLTDPAKVTKQHSWNPDTVLREVKFCHGIAFEAWAFWLYSLIGQLSDDRDLEDNSHDFHGSGQQAIAGPFVLPSRPMASLFLGHSGRDGISSKPSYISQGLFSTWRLTFTRPAMINGKSTLGRSAAVEKANGTPAPKPRKLSLKINKKRRLDDVLSSFE
ncbi:hypothetical protein NQ176_g4302 [Zarea fungicola]|uniref:Uncharacterized protein n=1 Tax=Zarea fungicola TaxID=93591 RepID=A0ACC1NGB5_9HYPO|nr:hypothetical protein NQ176_g4302 [Lecanicillium fungicola]